MAIDHQTIYYGGRFHKANSTAAIEIINPSTRAKIASVPDCNTFDVSEAVQSAVSALLKWRQIPARTRGQLLLKLGNLIRRDLEQLANLECTDIGRTIRECRAHVLRSAETCEYCGGSADKLEGRAVPQTAGSFAYTALEPYGVVGAITPWNPALLHIIQKSAHALATGNVVVIKLSPLACLSAYALAPLIEEAGFPAGTFNFITGGSDAGQALIQESNIDLISFTGSAIIGRTVASAAGAGGKPVHLELGGKAPALVFSDVNLEESAKDLAGAAFGSTGQSCTAATRIYVQEEVLGDFRSAFVNAATQFKSGDPFASDAGMGPLISEASWLRIRDLVSDAVDLGAEVLLGELDRKTPDNGFFMDSVILEGVTDEARITQEEVFGPVTTLYSFKDEADAITLANAGSHGLAAGVYTNDIHRARHLTASLKAGNIWINGYKKLDPALPFGGVKGSGFSRECGIDGLLAFCQPKTVVESYQVTIGQIPE